MTYIIKAQTAVGSWVNVVVTANSKRQAIKLAEPTIQQGLEYRIIKREMIILG